MSPNTSKGSLSAPSTSRLPGGTAALPTPGDTAGLGDSRDGATSAQGRSARPPSCARPHRAQSPPEGLTGGNACPPSTEPTLEPFPPCGASAQTPQPGRAPGSRPLCANLPPSQPQPVVYLIDPWIKSYTFPTSLGGLDSPALASAALPARGRGERSRNPPATFARLQALGAAIPTTKAGKPRLPGPPNRTARSGESE